MLSTEPSCTCDRATSRQWRPENDRLPTLNQWKWSKKTGHLNQLFTSMSDNTNKQKQRVSSMCNILTHALSLCRQTRMEETSRTYLLGKAEQLSGLKRRVDAAVATTIPLSTTHGGRPLHVQIVPYASSRPLEELTTRQKKRRRLSAELHQRIVQPPVPLIASPLPKLSPRECMTFAQLSGQQTHRALRAMRSFLNSKGLNFLCSDKKLHSRKRIPIAFTHPIH